MQHFKLKGLLIGNGWTDPKNQYPAYVSFAYDRGLIEPGSDEAREVESSMAKCRKAMDAGVHITMEVCEDVLNSVLRVTRDESTLSPLKMLTLDGRKRVALICTTFDCATLIHPVE